MKKTFGQQLRENAEGAPDKAARGTSGAWSIVLSAPGFMSGRVQEYWLTAKSRFPAQTPSAEDWVQLRKVIFDAGGPSHEEPDEAIRGTKMWRWKPAEGAEPQVAQEPEPFKRADEQLLVDSEAPPHFMTDKPGRNDPCACGSGKKYKKCCIDKPRVIGGCGVPLGEDGTGRLCGAIAAITLYCKKCGKQYPSCPDESHKNAAQQMMNGHVIRVHPEMIPVEIFDTWIKDQAWIAVHEEERAKNPALWARLFEYVEERRQRSVPN